MRFSKAITYALVFGLPFLTLAMTPHAQAALNAPPSAGITPPAGNQHPEGDLKIAPLPKLEIPELLPTDQQLQEITVQYGSNSVLSGLAVIYVAGDTGNDANDGSSWEMAKKTIPSALENVSSPGKIYIKQGEYPEPVSIVNRNSLSLYGGFDGTESSPDERQGDETVVDVNENGRPLTIVNSKTITIDKMTFRDGKPAGFGGGVYITRSNNFTMSNSVIEENALASEALVSFGEDGGGLYASSSAIKLQNLIVRDNAARGSGGGIALSQTALTGENVRLLHNLARHGGGAAFGATSGVLKNSFFNGNTAAQGSALETGEDTALTVVNGIFSQNTATEFATIYTHGFDSNPQLTNNTVSDNFSNGVTGLMMADYSLPELRNNIFSHNGQLPEGAQVVSGEEGPATIDHDSTSTSAAFIKNDFWENAGPNFAQAQDFIDFGAETLEKDPHYINRTFLNNPLAYQLMPGSEVIDKGVDGFNDIDFQGGPRPVAGGGVPGFRTDPGAFEFDGASQHVFMTFWDPVDQSGTPLHVIVKQGGGPAPLDVLDDSMVLQGPDGFYTTGGLFPAGTGPVDVWIKARGRVSKLLNDITFPKFNSPGQDVELIAGDANGDNQIDEQDVAEMVNHFGEFTDNERDITGDGQVTIYDLNLSFINFGAVGE